VIPAASSPGVPSASSTWTVAQTPSAPRRVVVKEAIARRRSLWDYGTDRGADDVSRAVERLVDQLLVRDAV
jgi:hypothetical protein